MKRLIICQLLLFFILGCSASKIQVKAPEPNPEGNITMSKFLEDAVFYGLQKDAAPLELVEKVKKGQLFVPKCPICGPVERGFNKHKQNLPEIVVKRDKNSVVAKMMNAEGKEKQQMAFRDLIAEYVDQYYTALKFNSEAKQKMQDELANGRKKGMSYKSDSFGKFCPSCDGACKIKMKDE